MKNMPDSIFFASHIYMTLAILCRRHHKVAFYRRTESEIQFAIPSEKECLRNGEQNEKKNSSNCNGNDDCLCRTGRLWK